MYNLAYGNVINTGAPASATLNLTNTLLAGSVGGTYDLVNDRQASGNTATITADDSLVQSGIGTKNGTTAPTVLTGNPLLVSAGLANYGGSTKTVALQIGSPAIDAGDNAAANTPD